MKTSIQQEKIIFAYMIKNPTYLLHIDKDFFSNDDIQYIASSAKQFFKEYKESPSCEQMKAILKDDKKDIAPEIVDSIYDVDINSLDNEWLQQTTEGWIRWRTFNTNLFKAASDAKTTEVSLSNVNDVVNKATSMVADTQLVNFDKDMGFDFFNPESHKSVKSNKIPFTWEYWNKISKGGLDHKTLHCYIGGTNVGKSIVLCNDAAEFVRRGKNTIFITCEMSPEKVARRISANLFDITLDEYDTLVESTEKVKKKLKNLSAMSMLPLGKLFIKEFPTGQCTVMDVERYIKEIEEQYKIKIDVVVIDYINIMCNYRNPNSENTYLKIKALAEDLRGLAVKYDFIVDTASQIGRSALDCSDIALTDVSESMGLAHTCDSIIGIIQTEEMRIGELDDETGKTIPYYWFKVLKIREGEGKDTKFRVNIIYNKMKLIEQTESIDMLSHFR